jgi:hypothetical protein
MTDESMWSIGEMINDKEITKYPGKKHAALLLFPRTNPTWTASQVKLVKLFEE